MTIAETNNAETRTAESAMAGKNHQEKPSAINDTAVYCLAPGVAIRPERFGGLVYRYDNRRLYFLHSHKLVEFVTALDGRTPLNEALATFFTNSNLPESTRTQFIKALNQLHKLGALIEQKPDSSTDNTTRSML